VPAVQPGTRYRGGFGGALVVFERFHVQPAVTRRSDNTWQHCTFHGIQTMLQQAMIDGGNRWLTISTV
jgi:hypothetical protein